MHLGPLGETLPFVPFVALVFTFATFGVLVPLVLMMLVGIQLLVLRLAFALTVVALPNLAKLVRRVRFLGLRHLQCLHPALE